MNNRDNSLVRFFLSFNLNFQMAANSIRSIIRLVLLIGTIASLFFVPWPLLIAWAKPLPNTVQEQVNRVTEYGFDGVIVYIDRGGTPPQLYAAGLKNKAHNLPADPHALFKIASIGKLYDAVAVAKLVSANRLSLEKTVAEYFPKFSDRLENADKITLRMLVQHRSGLPNVTNTPNFWTNPPKSNSEALERIFDLPAQFTPDETYEYSNTNYLLITELIEKTVGCSKFQYIKQEILSPLGLQNTFGSIHEVDMDDVMSGYYVGVKEDIKTSDYGSMVATAEDVGIFLRALNSGTLLTKEEEEIYTKLYRYNHTGLIPGYQSIAKYHADIDAVVIQFTNTTDFDGYHWPLSEILYSRIVKILRKEI